MILRQATGNHEAGFRERLEHERNRSKKLIHAVQIREPSGEEDRPCGVLSTSLGGLTGKL